MNERSFLFYSKDLICQEYFAVANKTFGVAEAMADANQRMRVQEQGASAVEGENTTKANIAREDN